MYNREKIKSFPMDFFRLLPEGCVSDILFFTSPKDAAISSAVSRGFNSATESDLLWGKFLPDDYEDISSRYVSPRICSSKKELYFSLCDSPVLMDGGKLVCIQLILGLNLTIIQCFAFLLDQKLLEWEITFMYSRNNF